ncbi:MAG: imidazole glycerol phosphate synthase subunit HisH [Methanobacteriaceae archaeon]|nr:imidazole glycerol phosphate synthase subunit HisH [Methanobacteriaceae archaeon]
MTDIQIIDYGSGNLRSIYNGFRKINVDVKIANDRNILKEADALVLPGVGAFGSSMENIGKFKDIILDHVLEDKPLLGICLGLQVLFESSEESPEAEGLGIFDGCVRHFNLGSNYKIPHMGWNKIILENKGSYLLKGMDGKYMYFVHSYYVDPVDKDIIEASVDYGGKVPVVVSKNNVCALQFHPEKSGKYGLQILQNFVDQIE